MTLRGWREFAQTVRLPSYGGGYELTTKSSYNFNNVAEKV